MTLPYLCLDASLTIKLVTQPKDQKLKRQFQSWQGTHQLVAPQLLLYEVTNALYQYQRHSLLSQAAVQSALQTVQALPIQLRGNTLLHKEALAIAQQRGLSATYDAHYLALAQRLDAELWTADKKLVNSVKKQLTWVKLW